MIKHQNDKRQKQYTLLLLIGMMSSILLAACVSRPQSHAEYTLEYRDTDHHEEDSHDETESLSVGHVHHHHEENLPQTPWTLGMAGNSNSATHHSTVFSGTSFENHSRWTGSGTALLTDGRRKRLENRGHFFQSG